MARKTSKTSARPAKKSPNAPKANTLWGGRFSGESDKTFAEFNNSFNFDLRLFGADVRASIAHERDDTIFQVTKTCHNRLQIGEQLHRMRGVGQSVDHGHVCVLGKFFEACVCVRTHDDGVEIA